MVTEILGGGLQKPPPNNTNVNQYSLIRIGLRQIDPKKNEGLGFHHHTVALNCIECHDVLRSKSIARSD